jgi:hypothetical protein
MRTREKKPSEFAKRGARCASIALTCLALVSVAGAQTESRPTARAQAKGNRTDGQNYAASLQRERATSLSAQLLEDDQWTNRFQGAVLYARLGEAWFSVDPKTGQQLLQQAVSTVAGDQAELGAQEREEQLDAARIILKVVMPLDRELGDRLLKIVEEKSHPVSARPETGLAERAQEARDLGDAASAIVNVDPRRAAELGRLLLQMRGTDMAMLSASLQVRAAGQISGLFASLRLADRETADQLFLQGIASASQDYDYNVLFTLSELAFPTIADPSRQPLPADLKAPLLNVMVDGLTLAWQGDQDRLRGCRIAPIAARLLPAFSPPQRAVVDDAMRMCTDGAGPAGGDEVQGILDPHSSADYLNAAETELDARRRCNGKSKAAFRALAQDRDAIAALNIWDHFTAEEREACPTWAADRELAAGKAIQAFYLRHDLRGMQAVFDRSPEQSRPKLQLSAAAILLSGEDKALGSWMLMEARRSLEKTDVDDPSVYLMLLTTGADISPGEIAQMLPLVVSGLNRVTRRKTESRLAARPAGYDLAPYCFGLSMLSVDPVFMEGSIATLESAEQRARFRLGLLHAAFEQYKTNNCSGFGKCPASQESRR